MKIFIASTLLAAFVTTPAVAQQNTADHAAHQVAPSTATAMSEGEIRKVDNDARKITIRHGTIVNLGMPPMTMVFQVKDPVLLEKVKTGDKVRFSAEKSEGAYIVTDIRKKE